ESAWNSASARSSLSLTGRIYNQMVVGCQPQKRPRITLSDVRGARSRCRRQVICLRQQCKIKGVELMATVATMPSEVWASYLAWNDAIAEVVVPELEVPEPVYLDLEDDVLSEIGARVGVAGGHAEALSRAVAATLGTGYRAFAPHSRR